MTTLYKATRPDGTDFHSGKVDYAAALRDGTVLTHAVTATATFPPDKRTDASWYFSVSVTPTDCTGMRWPCRLFTVEPVGESWTPDATDLPSKRACTSLRVTAELSAHEVFGPQGEVVAAIIDRASRLTPDEVERLDAARDAARAAAWDAAWAAAWAAARAAAWDAAWAAARAAAWAAARAAAWDAAWYAAAHVVRDLITPEQFGILAGPWNSVIGEVPA